MTAKALTATIPNFQGLDGLPLTAGYVYFGDPDQDPRQYPKTVFYDQALSVPAGTVLRTSAGYLFRNGSPTAIWSDGDCSILVLDANQRQVYYFPNWSGAGVIADISAVASISGDVTTVAGIAPKVTIVADNSANINTLAPHATDMGTLAPQAANIGTTATNIGSVNTVATNISTVNQALTASATSGVYPNAAATNVPRGLTQASVGAITPGAGGTNGTFALAWSGGNFSVNPTGTFTVSGGALTAVTITGPGLYIGSSPTVPTPSFAASTGLTGAAVALTAQFLVTAGQGYWVTSASGSKLDRYKNVGNVATADTSVGSILLQGAQEGLLVNLSTNERTSTDLLPSVTWTANTALFDTGTTGGAGGRFVSNFIAVSPGALLALVCGANGTAGSGSAATCIAYDEAQNFVSILQSGATAASPTTGNAVDNPAYITIPSNVRFIRIGQGTVTTNVLLLKLVSLADKFYADTLAVSLQPSSASNLLGAKLFLTAGGVVSSTPGNGTTTKASGYVPVSVGDKLTWLLVSGGGVFCLALYDSSKTFLRWLDQNGDIKEEKSYTLNAVDDASVAYAVASAFENPATSRPYFYVSSKNSLDRKITEQKGSTEARGLLRKTPTVSVGTNMTVTDHGTYQTVVTTAANALLAFSWPARRTAYPSTMIAVKVQLTALASGTTADFSWIVNPNPMQKSQTKTLAVGDTAVMYTLQGDITHYLQCSVSGATYNVLATTAIDFSTDQIADIFAPNAVLSEGISLPLALANSMFSHTRLFDTSYTWVDRSLRAMRADNLVTRFYGKKGAYFGNSIQYSAWPFIEQAFNLTMTMIAPNGANAQNCLTDANLALVPTDAYLVTIGFGSGAPIPDAGYVAAPDITSRDRTTSEGAMNYAIDWLGTNRPDAQIVLISPIYCGEPGRDNTKWNTAHKNLAAYRQIPLCDCWNLSDISSRNWTRMSDDNIHLNAKGHERHSGVIAGFLRSLSV